MSRTAEWRKAYYEAKRREPVPADKHGTHTGYITYKCRCLACRTFKSEYDKRYQKRNRERGEGEVQLSPDKIVNKLVADIKQVHGYEFRKNGANHIQMFDPKSKRLLYTMSSTPSDVHWRGVVIRDMKRLGLIKGDPAKELNGKKSKGRKRDMSDYMRENRERTATLRPLLKRLYHSEHFRSSPTLMAEELIEFAQTRNMRLRFQDRTGGDESRQTPLPQMWSRHIAKALKDDGALTEGPYEVLEAFVLHKLDELERQRIQAEGGNKGVYVGPPVEPSQHSQAASEPEPDPEEPVGYLDALRAAREAVEQAGVEPDLGPERDDEGAIASLPPELEESYEPVAIDVTRLMSSFDPELLAALGQQYQPAPEGAWDLVFQLAHSPDIDPNELRRQVEEVIGWQLLRTK